MILVEELLKRNANVNTPNNVGVTPIWNALNNPDIVSLLIENGAKTDIVLEGNESIITIIKTIKILLKKKKNFFSNYYEIRK